MIKMLGILALAAIMVVATIGLAGQGPVWVRYVGAITVLGLLIAISAKLNNLVEQDSSSEDAKSEAPSSSSDRTGRQVWPN